MIAGATYTAVCSNKLSNAARRVAFDAERLRAALLLAALDGEAERGMDDVYCRRYTVDFEMAGHDRMVRI